MTLTSAPSDDWRCPHCDTRNRADHTQCRGCGKPREQAASASSLDRPKTALPPRPARPAIQHLWLKSAIVLISLAAFWAAWQVQRNPGPLYLAQPPTPVESRAISTPTPSRTPLPPPAATATATATATPEPSATPTPLPSATPLPPVLYQIVPGEVLLNIALRFNVSVESIVAANPGIAADTIVAGQTINVPLPTATPPLTPIEVEIGGEQAIADPTDCVTHEIQTADTYSGLAQRYNISLDAILRVNRITERNVPQPGDTVCIPKIVYIAAPLDQAGRVPGQNPPATQPLPLWPADGARFAPGTPVLLQWVARRDLAADEWYMVELTDLTDPQGRPLRNFTRQTSFQVPESWLTSADFPARYRWRLSYVRLAGDPAGTLRYTWNGPAAEQQFVLAPGD
jgi:LysM repeat protein